MTEANLTNANVGAVYGDARSVAMTSDGGNDQIRASGSIVAAATASAERAIRR